MLSTTRSLTVLTLRGMWGLSSDLKLLATQNLTLLHHQPNLGSLSFLYAPLRQLSYLLRLPNLLLQYSQQKMFKAHLSVSPASLEEKCHYRVSKKMKGLCNTLCKSHRPFDTLETDDQDRSDL